ncbi:uncharacterized protein LOC106669995 isoform X2 [Cimex lectularius]|uniref:Uncharacterized protein n=1 Tax=Cimex lectularius TaxID=79782 RepID=A0A8I6S466_CIMLE|nr:uncharacterized protein LOC106669995 isoform X2 [Cimex lectularius]
MICSLVSELTLAFAFENTFHFVPSTIKYSHNLAPGQFLPDSTTSTVTTETTTVAMTSKRPTRRSPTYCTMTLPPYYRTEVDELTLAKKKPVQAAPKSGWKIIADIFNPKRGYLQGQKPKTTGQGLSAFLVYF